MEKKKYYNIYFYSIECQRSNFQEILDNDSIIGKRLSLRGDSYYIILNKIEKKKNVILGTFVKVKMDDIPSKYNLTSNEAGKLELSEVEGLGDNSSFLYWKDKNILFFQSTKSGITTRNFCSFFEKYGNCGSMDLAFILGKDAFKKLSECTYISTLDVTIKGLQKGEILENPKNDVESVIKTFNKLRGRNITFRVTSGNSSDGLNLKEAINYAKDTFSAMTGLFKKDTLTAQEGHITVSGKGVNMKKVEPIDLIVERFKRKIEIKYTERQSPNFKTKEIYNAMLELYGDVYRELNELY